MNNDQYRARDSVSSSCDLYGHKEVTTFSYTHDDKRRMSRKGTKKMKKNYLGFGLVYCVLALVIFSVLMSFYTKKKKAPVHKQEAIKKGRPN